MGDYNCCNQGCGYGDNNFWIWIIIIAIIVIWLSGNNNNLFGYNNGCCQ